MGASATLSAPALFVEPGTEVAVEVAVRNTGDVVDSFSVEVLGDPAVHAVAEPAVLPLFPGADGTVVVRFAPPRAPGTVAGSFPYAVRVTSQEDPDGSVVEEGTLEIGRFSDLAAELAPRTSTGSRRSRHELAVDNRGNGPVAARLLVSDPDGLLRFEAAPLILSLPAGTAAFAQVRVFPVRRFWRGTPRTVPFQVLVEPDVGVPLAVDGTFVQGPLVPRWLPRALLALLALVLLLVILWFTVLRPSVESAAREAAQEQVSEQISEALAEQAAGVEEAQVAAEEAAEAASGAAGGASEAASAASGAAVAASEDSALLDEITGGGAGGGGGPLVGLNPLVGPSTSFRLAGTTAAGQTASTSFPITDGRFALTDVVLQNPEADLGLLQIRRGATAVLFEVRMENFRDLDYHFVTPTIFDDGQAVTLTVDCENPPPTACQASAYFSGVLQSSPASSSLPAIPDPEPSPTGG